MTHSTGWRWLGLVVVLTAGTGRQAAAGGDTRAQPPILFPAGVAGPAGPADGAAGTAHEGGRDGNGRWVT
jgi:hypothetical protein